MFVVLPLLRVDLPSLPDLRPAAGLGTVSIPQTRRPRFGVLDVTERSVSLGLLVPGVLGKGGGVGHGRALLLAWNASHYNKRL